MADIGYTPQQAGMGKAHAVVITPSSSPLPHVLSGLWVGAGGDLTVQFAGQNAAIVIAGVPPNTYFHDWVLTYVLPATTAGSLVGFY